MLEFLDGTQEPAGKWLTLLTSAAFLQQQVAEFLLEPIDEFQRRKLGQVSSEPGLLIVSKVVSMATHQRQQAAMFGSHWIQFPPASQEVVVDQPDDMESIRQNHGIGKVFSGNRAIHRSQVHANDTNLFFAFQSFEIRL